MNEDADEWLLRSSSRSKVKGAKVYGRIPAEESEEQTFSSRSNIARLVSLTPSEEREELRDVRPYLPATGWPKDPPPWTRTIGRPDELISLPRARTTASL